MPRLLNDWLAGYIKFTKDTEPPLSYHTWVGISLVSSALERRVFLEWGHSSIIYPNQYIVLIGPSGLTRKGEAINIGRQLVEKMGTRIVSQSIIKEQLIRSMKDSVTTFNDAFTGEIKFQCCLYGVFDELAVFLGQQDTKFLAMLTDWYDSRPEWTYETKHQGTDRINGVCFSILASCAPDWLPSILPSEAVGGGFTSRIVFVVEEHKAKSVADPADMQIDEGLQDRLVNDLEEIRMISGAMKFEKKALDAYVKWYKVQDAQTKKGNPPIGDPKFAGYNSRRQTVVRKLCMVMSASRGDSMIITQQDFKRSLALIEAAEKKMPTAFKGMGKARFSEATTDVLRYIMHRGKVRRSEVLQHFFRDLDSWMLEQIERVLEQMHVVRVSSISKVGDQDAVYEYVGPREEGM